MMELRSGLILQRKLELAFGSELSFDVSTVFVRLKLRASGRRLPYLLLDTKKTGQPRHASTCAIRVVATTCPFDLRMAEDLARNQVFHRRATEIADSHLPASVPYILAVRVGESRELESIPGTTVTYQRELVMPTKDAVLELFDSAPPEIRTPAFEQWRSNAIEEMSSNSDSFSWEVITKEDLDELRDANSYLKEEMRALVLRVEELEKRGPIATDVEAGRR